MTSYPFVAGLSIEPSRNTTKACAGSRSPGPSIEELDKIELADYGNLAHAHSTKKFHITTPPSGLDDLARAHVASKACHSIRDLENSRPPTPKQSTATSAVPSFSYPKMNRWRVLAACVVYFGNGMSDSAPGALLPYIEDYYHIGYAVVSLIWVANACGFILSAFFNDVLTARLGRAKSLMLSASFMATAYAIIAGSPPFPAVVVAYLILGFGNGLNLALNNVFCANLADSTVILGLAHGSYGIGGIIAPLVATVLVSNQILWARFYLIPLGVQVCCFFFAGWAFWTYEKEGTSVYANALQQVASRQSTAGSDEPSKLRLLGRALRTRTTIIGALIIFSYQGAEVTESGWFISYLIDYRHGNPAHVGYVTSGFWAGVTVGRFVLTHIAHRVGEKRFVFAVGLGVIALQLMAWLIPGVVGDAVSVAILGLLLGPIYPCAQTIFTRLLPSNLQVVAISFISSAGSSGGAVVPFLTGLVAQSAGTFVMHPICIAFYVLMLAGWAALPRLKKMAAE